MALAMEAIIADAAPQTTCDLLAELRYGMNGSPDGAPTFDAGTASDPSAAGWNTWDGDIYDGVDSGWRDVELTINANNGQSYITWSVDGQAITYDAASFNYLSQIQIVADSSAQALMSWKDIAVSFYHNGTQVDSYASASGPTVDQTANENPVEMADILTLTPQAGQITSIHLDAKVRMACPEGVYLDQNSVFGQVLITTANV